MESNKAVVFSFPCFLHLAELVYRLNLTGGSKDQRAGLIGRSNKTNLKLKLQDME